MLRKSLLFLAGAVACAALAYVALTQGVRAPAGLPAGAASLPPVATAASASDTGGVPATEAPRTRPDTGPPPAARPVSPATAPAPPPRPVPRPAATHATGPAGLIVPVAGIRAAELSNTFGDARGSERMHEALDIMAPAGTPVLAVADGHVEKLFDSAQGGLTIYQFEPSGRYAYYYAHLQRYAPGLAEGQALRQGQLIGYVGSSGNADPAAPHLHFAVFLLGPERQWWRGTPINPYPLFRAR